MSLFLPQVLLEPCGSSGAECWRNPDSQWPSPYQTCGMCAAPPLELDPNNCTRSILNKSLCTNKNHSFWQKWLIRSYLFIKNEAGGNFVFRVKEDGSLQTKLWDENNDCILPHKQNISFFVQYASSLEEQLKDNRLWLGQCNVYT